MATVLSALVLMGCHSAKMERQLHTLCTLDGGMRIYESATLPATYFDKFGGVITHDSMPTGRADGSWFSRIGHDEYRFVITLTYVAGKKSLGYDQEEALVRSHEGIYKWPEKRLLGEQVMYSHGYGTRFSFGFQPGGSHCPLKRENLFAAVFPRPK